MIPVQGLFEAHLTVRDLERAVRFYRDQLGLVLAALFPERQAAFFWLGPPGHTMLGLWGTGPGPQTMSLHTAFRVSLKDILGAPAALEAAGIQALDFDGAPTREPVVLAWMPAAAVYFRDPDGHMIEYIAMLPEEPRPGRGVVRWSEW